MGYEHRTDPDDRGFEDKKKVLDEINGIRDQAIKPLIKFRNKTKGKKNARDFVKVKGL